jgi:uncharacterized protein involved in exopolysaccharide biosynthesis/Mrp family chromosome partitioning ATPase
MGLYVSPDPKTLSSLVTDPAILGRLREEFMVPYPIKALEKNLTVVQPSGSKTLTLFFRWDERERATRMLDRLTAIYVEHLASVRCQALQVHIRDLEQSRGAPEAKLASAKAGVAAFCRREGLESFERALTERSEELDELAGLEEGQRRAESELLAQQRFLALHLEDVKSREEANAQEAKQFEASAETVADNRRRQDRLRELIAEERKIQEINAKLEAKSREHDRAVQLHARRLAPLASVEALKAEMDGLRSQVEETENIKRWQDELERIDKVVVPKGTSKNVGSPIIQQTLFRKLELELELTGLREQMGQVAKRKEKAQAELGRLGRLRSEYEGLNGAVDRAMQDLSRLEAQVGVLRQLQGLKSCEYSVASAAKSEEFATKSTRKQTTMMVGALGTFLSFALCLGLEARAGRLRRPWRRRLDLPLLARLDGYGGRREALRGLALRIRQRYLEPGVVVVFAPAGAGAELGLLGWLLELASCLAARDEEVVLLEADLSGHGRTAEWDGPGLREYLGSPALELSDVCRPTEVAGVWRLGLGTAEVSPDGLATHRMRALVETLRQRFSIVLVWGAAVESRVDAQILAGYADAVIPVVGRTGGGTSGVRGSVEVLRALGAEMPGQVVSV